MTLYNHYDLNIDHTRNYITASYRHAVRKAYRMSGMTLRDICDLEYRETGRRPHHSTIIASCHAVDSKILAIVLKTHKALKYGRFPKPAKSAPVEILVVKNVPSWRY
jgi:hypothetical protein